MWWGYESLSTLYCFLRFVADFIEVHQEEYLQETQSRSANIQQLDTTRLRSDRQTMKRTVITAAYVRSHCDVVSHQQPAAHCISLVDV